MTTLLSVMKTKKQAILTLLMFVVFFSGLYAQTARQSQAAQQNQGGQNRWGFPNASYWSLDAGYGTTDILVNGLSQQFIVDPKLWLSPLFMVGNKFSVNYSTDKILAFEEQVYLRWNFLRTGRTENPVNIFLQSGMGILAMYRVTDNLFGDVKNNRGSLLFDMAAGATIPLTSRWHIEPAIRGGYPHIMGASITAGYKFPLSQRSKYGNIEIIKRIIIAGIDSIMFGPDTEQYNVDIDQNVQERNETVLNIIAKTLKDNPDFRLRIEGHANPVTKDPAENDRLISLSKMRADTVAQRLMAKGVTEEQMFLIGLGGTKIISYDIRDMNRRVELIVIQINNDL
jgi:hypothetical protein